MPDALDARLAALSEDELEFLDTLSPEELKQALGEAPAPEGQLKLPTPPTREGMHNVVGDVADRMLGEEGSPRGITMRPMAEQALESGLEFAKDNTILGAFSEGGAMTGAAAARMAPKLIAHPLGRKIAEAVLPAVGSALGYAGGDAALDTVDGEEVDIDPAMTTVAGAIPLAAPAMRLGGQAMRGSAQLARSGLNLVKSPSKAAGTLLDYVAKLADGNNNLPHAFGMKGGKAFDARNPIIPAEAIKRMDDRGVFKALQPTRKTEKLATSVAPNEYSIYSDFGDIRKAWEAEKRRLVGDFDEAKVITAEAGAELGGEVATWANKINKTMPLADLEDTLRGVRNKFTEASATGQVDKAATRIIDKEINKLRQLTLDEDEFQQLETAYTTIREAEKQIHKKALKPATELDEQEIMELFGVKMTQEGDINLKAPGSKRFLNYKEALSTAQKLEAEARGRPVKFEQLAHKRARVAALARYGANSEDAATSSQVMTAMADALRGKEDDIARLAGQEGAEYLRTKGEYADLKSVEDFIFMSESNQNKPFFSSFLSFGLGPFVTRNAAGAVRQDRFRLTKRNLGQAVRGMSQQLQNNSPTAQAADAVFKTVAQVTAEPPIALVDKAGQFTLDAGKVLGSQDSVTSFLANTIVNSTVFSFLRDRKIAELNQDELAQVLANPLTQQVMQETEESASMALQPLHQALVAQDREATIAALAGLSKQFPEAFVPPETGIRGEVLYDGKRMLPLEEDREKFRAKLRSSGDVSLEEKAEIMNELNRSGTVLRVPKPIKPKRPSPEDPDELPSFGSSLL